MLVAADQNNDSRVDAEDDSAPPSAYWPSPRYPNPLRTRVEDIPGPWWIAWTRPQYEKRFAAALFDLRIEHYLPLAERRSYASGDRVGHIVHAPLFTGYVFFAGDEYAVYDARGTKRVLDVIRVVDQGRLVRQLINVQLALDIEPDLGKPGPLAKGAPVRVIAGPFMGLEGTFEEVDGRGRFTLALEMIGKSTPVENILPEMVEPI